LPLPGHIILVDVDRSRNVFSTYTYETVLAHEKRLEPK